MSGSKAITSEQVETIEKYLVWMSAANKPLTEFDGLWPLAEDDMHSPEARLCVSEHPHNVGDWSVSYAMHKISDTGGYGDGREGHMFINSKSVHWSEAQCLVRDGYIKSTSYYDKISRVTLGFVFSSGVTDQLPKTDFRCSRKRKGHLNRTLSLVPQFSSAHGHGGECT
jgi:hypothetical protein